MQLKKYKKVLLIDQGKRVEQRNCPIEKTKKCVHCQPMCNITNGFSGAGAFSDGKLSLYNEEDEDFYVGGNLHKYIGVEETKRLIDYTDRIYLDFGADEKLEGIDYKEEVKKIKDKAKKEEITLKKYLLEIKDYILKNLYDNNKKSFVRNKDGKMDISLLGLVTPFKIFSPKEKKILNTIERMDLSIRTYTGGYLRYEGDNYVGGNPWVIANLWMAEYYLEAGNKKKARECFEFVVKSGTEHGFLGEQVDNSTMQAKWVIGLGWSHAMFINVLNKLYK